MGLLLTHITKNNFKEVFMTIQQVAVKLIGLSLLYLVGYYLVYGQVFEGVGIVLYGWFSDENTSLVIPFQHFIVTMLAAIPVSIGVAYQFRKHQFIIGMLTALPIILMTVTLIVSRYNFHVWDMYDQLLMTIFTPAILSWLFGQIVFFKRAKE
jgi:hypothetical protein